MSNADGHLGADAIHRYVAGTATDGEVARVEVHMLECPACTREVRDGAALAASLRAPNASRPERRRALPRRMIAVGAALAAGVTFAVLAARDTPLERLARLDTPPSFQPIAVRATVNPSDRLVDSAMGAYVAREYGVARRLLDRAVAVTPATSVRFYLGAAALADGVAGDAIIPLERVVMDDGPYAPRARVLLAKALVATGRADSAIALLSGASDAGARAFAESLRTATRGP
jgi:hypothetical protein